MPHKPGYLFVSGRNIPLTTKGPAVENCLSVCYPACMKGHGEDKTYKRICAATCHKRCG